MWARDLRQSLNSRQVMLVPLNSDAAGPKRKKLLGKDFVIKKLKQIFPTDVSSQRAVTLSSKWPEQQGSRSTSKPWRGYLGTASGTKELVPRGVVSPSITEGAALTASQRAAATCCTAGTVPQTIHLLRPATAPSPARLQPPPQPGYSPLGLKAPKGDSEKEPNPEKKAGVLGRTRSSDVVQERS